MATPVPLPYKGINRGTPVANQSPEYSSQMQNVRPKDVLEGKLRLGQRPGLKKWGEGTLIGGVNQPVVAMCAVSSVR